MGELLWWHRVGQNVVCVDDESYPEHLMRFDRPQVNKIYTIRDILWKGGLLFFCLHEIGAQDDGEFTDVAWLASRFRPVRSTSIDCFRYLLNPTPDKVREMEDAHAC